MAVDATSPPRRGVTCSCWFAARCWRRGDGRLPRPLRIMGLGEAAGFAVHHRVLSHGHWCSRAVAHRLSLLLVAAFGGRARWWPGSTTASSGAGGRGSRRAGSTATWSAPAEGTSHKASGLRWLCVMLLAPVPWAGCVWGLPFLTVLMWTAGERMYRAVQFQATGRSKTRPLRRSAANVIGQRKPKPHKPLQPIRPLDSRWLEPAAHGVEVA